MKKLIYLLFLLVSFAGWGQVHQHTDGGFCGTPSPSLESQKYLNDLIERLKKKKSNAKISTEEIKWVGIKAWVFSDGTNKAISNDNILKYIFYANKAFDNSYNNGDIKIQFFLKEIETVIDNTVGLKYFNLELANGFNNSVISLLNKYDENALNVYFYNEAKCTTTNYTLCNGQQGSCDVPNPSGFVPSLLCLPSNGGFPSPTPWADNSTNQIFLQGNIAVEKLPYNLAHELGHYFSLYHTFSNNYTQDCEGRTNNDTQYGDMVEDTNIDIFDTWIKKTINGDTLRIKELKNCPLEQNDIIYRCIKVKNGKDTEGIDYEVNKNDIYYLVDDRIFSSGPCSDRLLSWYNPPFDNIMSYWRSKSGNTCTSNLTKGQNDRIVLGFDLRTINQGALYNIQFTPKFISTPQVSIQSLSQNSVELAWNLVNNALGYIIEKAISYDGIYTPIGYLTSTTLSYRYSSNIENPNYLYYRVRCVNSNIYNYATLCTSSLASQPYTNGERTVEISNWYSQDVSKATRLGLMNKDRWGNDISSDNAKLIVGEAAKSIVITANLLGIPGYSNVAANCSEANTYIPYVNHLKLSGFLPSNTQSDDVLTTGLLCEMIKKFIMESGTSYPYGVSRADMSSVIAANAPYKSSIEYLYSTIGFRKGTNGKPLGGFFFDGKYDNTFNTRHITGNEDVTRAVFAKFISTAYEFKYYLLNSQLVPNARVGAVAQTNSVFDDIIILGSKAEFDNDISGIPPTVTIEGSTEYLLSGQSKNFSFSTDQLSDGTKVFFYWNVEGATKGLTLVPMAQYATNFQGVTLTAPTVTTTQTFQFYIHISTVDGRTAEMFKEIVVTPNISNGNANLTNGEYFIDNDLGIGQATPLPFTFSGRGVDATIPIPTNNLTQGIHTVGIRVKDSNNYWSLTHTRPFLVLGVDVLPSSLSKVEYFLDTDPGLGSGIQVTYQANANGQALLNVDLSGVSTGVHVAYVRVKDNSGRWSLTHARPFLVLGLNVLPSSLSQVEYFLDTDPGFGNGTQVAYQTNANGQVSLNLDMAGVSRGVHVVYVRVKDNSGRWSLTHARAFVVMPDMGESISRIEYFIDANDPGQGSGTSVAFVPNPSTNNVTATFDLNIGQLSLGQHALKVRAQDSRGSWSSVQQAAFEVMQPPCPADPTITLTITQPTCASTTGTIVVNTTSSGTLEYSKDGTNWQASSTFSNLGSGSYPISVRLQSSPTCVTAYVSNPVVINAAPTPPIVNTATVTQPTCAMPTGAIVVTATGSGVLEYTKNGSIWQANSTFSDLSAGNYPISVRLQSSPTCITAYANNPVVINAAPTPPTVSELIMTQPTCATTTGTIAINATGSSTLEYSKDGNNWQVENTFSGLNPGNYNLSVRLQSSPTCVTSYISNPVIINATPTAPTVNTLTVTQPTCATPTGTIEVNATGSGTLEYSRNGTNWQASNIFNSLAAGNYTISVRLQSSPTCITAYASNPVIINAAPTAPTINTLTVTQPTCATSTGIIVVNAVGSDALEYSKDGTLWQTSGTFSSLSAGNYTISVRLQSSPTCVTTYTGNPVVINAAPTVPVVNSTTVTQPTCATPTGTIAVNATGSGTLEYSKDGNNWQANNTFSNLLTGSYSISVRLQSSPTCVTPYAGNPVVINATLTAPTVSAVMVTQPTCATPTGTIAVNATGSGTLEYSNNGTTWQASGTFNSLAAGNYTISVRLQSSLTCMTAYANNPVIINAAPMAPTISAVTLTQPTCATPTATIVVNAAGSGVLEYSKDGTLWQTNSTFSSLSAGNYTISVRLQSSPTCVTAYVSNPAVINTAPTVPVVNGATVTQPTCATLMGTIAVNATESGTLEYSKDGNNWQANNTFSNLSPGSYSISVRLQSSPTCVTTYAGNPVIINVAPTAPLVNAVTATQPTCAIPTGTITVNAASSGILEYSKDGNNWQASSTFSNLGSGNYPISVRLQSSPTCVTAYAGNPVVINVAPTAPTLNTLTVTQPTCVAPTGAIVVNAAGSGTLEYSKNGVNWQTNSIFSSLAAGNYTISVRLQSSPTCVTAYVSNPVIINAAPTSPLVNTVTATQPTCVTPMGTIAVNATGSGTLEYSKDGNNWQTNNTFSNLSAGNFTIFVRLQSSPTCVTTYASNPVVINTAPTAPVVNGATVTQPTCAIPTGTIVVNATSSGTLEYSRNGTNWQTNNTFSNLSPGSYSISVRLQSNPTCITAYSNNPLVINAVPTVPIVSAPTITQPTCAVSTGTIVINAAGSGTLEYSRNGTNWQAGSTFSSLSAGSYTISVRLQSSPTCITAYVSNPVIINTAPTAPTISAVTLTQPTCATPTGTILVNTAGSGVLEYSKDGTLWQTTGTFSNLSAGSYTISVRLQSSPTCVTAYANNPVIINVAPTAPTINTLTVTQPTCATPTGTIVVNATGSGTLEYSRDGNNWQSSNTFSSLSLGSYNISVRLQSNPTCVTAYASNPVIINATPTPPTINTLIVTQPTCAAPTGTVVVNATGDGTLEYSRNGTNWQTNNTFSSLNAASYTISVRLQSSPTCVTAYTGNPVVINAAPTAPVVSGATVRQPTCATLTGTIIVSATGGGTLEYSKDGTNWQPNNIFNGLTADSYHISIRLQSSPTCVTTYTNNPVIINVPPTAPIVGVATVTQPTCLAPTGTIVVNATGSSALEYSRDGINWQADNMFIGLNAASYTLSVRLLSNPTCLTVYAGNPIVINTAPVAPIVSAVTVTQPTCLAPTGTIVVNATGSGALEYSRDGNTWQANNTFSNLSPGSYNISVRVQANPECVIPYINNPVIIGKAPNVPTIFNVSGGGIICPGSENSISITLNGSQTNTNYQLKRNEINTDGLIAGTGIALTFNNQVTAGNYTIVATSIDGCNATMNGTASVILATPPTIYNLTGGGGYCASGAGVEIGLSNSQIGVKYQLKQYTVNVGSSIAGTGNVISFGKQLNPGIYTVIATDTVTTCTSNMKDTISVFLIQPAGVNITGNQTITSGQSANLILTFTGDAPWSVVVNRESYSSINTSPYQIVVSPTETTTYTISSVSNICGVGIVSGSALVTVNKATPCPPTLTHGQGSLPAGMYQASETISSQADITTPTIYKAGTSITLSAGFSAGPNEVFEAKIEGCTTTTSVKTVVKKDK